MSNILSIKVGAVFLSLIALIVAVQSAQATEPSLRIGTDGAYPPYGSTTSAGKLVGFEIELMEDLCKRMKTQCQFVVVDWNGMIPKLQEGTVDIIMSGLSIKPERRKAIDFSLPYFSAPTYFVAPKGSPLLYKSDSRVVDLTTIEPTEQQALDELARHLKNAVVGVEGATSHEAYVRRHFPASGQVRIYPKQESLFLDLSIGRVDTAVAGYSVVNRFIQDQRKKGHEYIMFGPGVRGGALGEGVALGLRKGNSRLERNLNEALRAAARAGIVSTLSKKWFGIDGSIRYENTVAAK